MYGDRAVLAVVPARGGSKGLPRKNLRPLLGLPLVAHAGVCARQVAEIDAAVVSTDDEEIAAAAKAHGLDAPFRRPEAISGDRIGDWDVLHHALGAAEAHYARRFDVVVMLQPTSPLRRPEHVRAAIAKLVDEDLDAVWTVSETDSKGHPLKQLIVDTEGMLDYYDQRGREIVARQQLTPVYHRNGIAYAMTRDCLDRHRTIGGPRTAALVIDGAHVSIDTAFDLKFAEFVAGLAPHAS